MGHSIQDDTETPALHDDGWQPRPELLRAMREIGRIFSGDDTAVITDREIRFDNRGQQTTITAANVDLMTVDGLRISERIDVRATLPEVISSMTLEQIALANTMATTAAIVRDPVAGNTTLASSVTVFEADKEALQELFVPLIGKGALVQLDGPQVAAHRYLGAAVRLPDETGLPAWDQPSFWGVEEFEYAVDIMRRAGIYCNAGETGLTAEFPWEKGACSAMLNDCTSLMRFQNDVSHPVAGNGLFFR